MSYNQLRKKTIICCEKILRSPWLYRFLRLVLGSVFVYAGFIKLIDPTTFAKIISQYDIVPESLLAPIAVGLPAVELLAGLGLIFNIRGSLMAIFILLSIFCIVLGYGIYNNLNIDCGCFSPEEIKEHNNLKQAFYRDLMMIGGAIFLFLSRSYYTKNTSTANLWTKLKSIKRRS